MRQEFDPPESETALGLMRALRAHAFIMDGVNRGERPYRRTSSFPSLRWHSQ